ncbi:MAG: hypothetical protein WC509_01400 [Candidatus Izemoplasmatales bacterium]
MNRKDLNLPIIIIVVSAVVFVLSVVALAFGDFLADTFDVIGIRIAMLIVAFASFCSSSLFSLLIYSHNRTASRINDDTNRRAELFRELTFASSNYSIIEFIDRMLIYDESERYVERYVDPRTMEFHMVDARIDDAAVCEDRREYRFTSMKIPFRVLEGKYVSGIAIERLSFERDGSRFDFRPCGGADETDVFILYNETTKRHNVIINLITPKETDFFLSEKVNAFSKIVIQLCVTSLLGVKVKGVSHLYFTNPEQIEAVGSNTYRINSATFALIAPPQVTHYPQ